MNSLHNGLIAQLAPSDQVLLLRNAPIIRFKAGDVLALGLGVSSLKFIAQSPGAAYAVDPTLAQRLVRRKASLLLAFTRYLWTEYESVTVLAAMSHTQDIRLRLAHWLLLSAQRCAPDLLVLTHAHIAHMLGVRRASISLAARDMKMAGLINYSRGQFSLKNQKPCNVLRVGRVGLAHRTIRAIPRLRPHLRMQSAGVGPFFINVATACFGIQVLAVAVRAT